MITITNEDNMALMARYPDKWELYTIRDKHTRQILKKKSFIFKH